MQFVVMNDAQRFFMVKCIWKNEDNIIVLNSAANVKYAYEKFVPG